jgi:hypothetical protein
VTVGRGGLGRGEKGIGMHCPNKILEEPPGCELSQKSKGVKIRDPPSGVFRNLETGERPY